MGEDSHRTSKHSVLDRSFAMQNLFLEAARPDSIDVGYSNGNLRQCNSFSSCFRHHTPCVSSKTSLSFGIKKLCNQWLKNNGIKDGGKSWRDKSERHRRIQSSDLSTR